MLLQVFFLCSWHSYHFCTCGDLFTLLTLPSLSSWFLIFLERGFGFEMHFPFQVVGLIEMLAMCVFACKWPCEFDWLVRRNGHGVDSTNSFLVLWFCVPVSAQSYLLSSLPPGPMDPNCLGWGLTPILLHCGHGWPGCGGEAPPYLPSYPSWELNRGAPVEGCAVSDAQMAFSLSLPV